MAPQEIPNSKWAVQITFPKKQPQYWGAINEFTKRSASVYQQGLADSELYQSEIPLSEDKQHEFHGDISRQFEEISRLLEEYLQLLKDMPRNNIWVTIVL